MSRPNPVYRLAAESSSTLENESRTCAEEIALKHLWPAVPTSIKPTRTHTRKELLAQQSQHNPAAPLSQHVSSPSPRHAKRRSSLRLCTNEAGVGASRQGKRFGRDGLLQMTGFQNSTRQLHRSASHLHTRLLLIAIRRKSFMESHAKSQGIGILRSTEKRSSASFRSSVRRLNQACDLIAAVVARKRRLLIKPRNPALSGFRTGRQTGKRQV